MAAGAGCLCNQKISNLTYLPDKSVASSPDKSFEFGPVIIKKVFQIPGRINFIKRNISLVQIKKYFLGLLIGL